MKHITTFTSIPTSRLVGTHRQIIEQPESPDGEVVLQEHAIHHEQAEEVHLAADEGLRQHVVQAARRPVVPRWREGGGGISKTQPEFVGSVWMGYSGGYVYKTPPRP